MYPFIQKFHSGWAYLALLILLIAVVNALLGKFSKRSFSATDRKISLFALIAIHIQLLVGLVLYFVSHKGLQSFGEMKNAALRLTWLEHPLINIIAIALITIGWSRHKKTEDNNNKFSSIGVFYGLGLILILLRIPWQMWF